MQFIYHSNAGETNLLIQGDLFIHLYKSRRTKQTQVLFFRNLKDDFLYQYKQEQIDKKSALLVLENQTLSSNKPRSPSHLILAMIDSKSLQKALPFLNELGVGKLTLFYADYSQHNEKIDLDKLHKILINSSQQCGRSNILEVEILENLDCVLKSYPMIGVFDFGGEKLAQKLDFPILIGPEGGFSSNEREKLKSHPTYSTQENIILRSESACVFIASTLQNLG